MPRVERIIVRRACAADAEALTDLHLDVWDEAYAGLVPPHVLAARRDGRADRIDTWRDRLQSDVSDEWLALMDVDGGRLLGFASVGAGRSAAEPGLPPLEVMALYVRAEVYGSGVGHALMEAAIGDKAAYLWVLDGNRRAIRFYERQGFSLDGRAKVEPVGVERRMVRGASVDQDAHGGIAGPDTAVTGG